VKRTDPWRSLPRADGAIAGLAKRVSHCAKPTRIGAKAELLKSIFAYRCPVLTLWLPVGLETLLLPHTPWNFGIGLQVFEVLKNISISTTKRDLGRRLQTSPERHR